MRLSKVIAFISSLCLLQRAASAKFESAYQAINDGQQRSICEMLASVSSGNTQYPDYCTPSRVKVVALIEGSRQHSTRQLNFVYDGPILRTANVVIVTEQDGVGDIVAKFNGATLECNGLSAKKLKSCTIPSRSRPWSGRITVEVLSRGHRSHQPSTGLDIRGQPYCPTTGFDGDNCDEDVDECVKYQRSKDKQLCAWKPGCVNTIGSYKCTCPPGYRVSAADFRLCDIIKVHISEVPYISTRPSTVTAMLMQTATLPCRYTAPGPVEVRWQAGKTVIAIKKPNGAKESVNPGRITIQDNGDLVVKQVKYGDMAKLVCEVQDDRIGAYVTHTLAVESVPYMEANFLVSGNRTSNHAYRVGDDVTIDCNVVAMPVPTITWMKGQQQLQTEGRIKVTLDEISDMKVSFAGLLLLKLQIMDLTTADTGVYTCKASNIHGENTQTIEVTVRPSLKDEL